MTALTGRSVLVTGAASGIGAAVAGRCLRAGAQVGGIDIDRAALAEAASAHGACFTAIPVDIRDELAVHTALAALGSRFTDVHGLVNCAGVGGYTGDVTETSVTDWQRIIGVNLTGAYVVSRVVLPRMRGRPGAALVHVSSQYGMVGGAGFPAYCAAKAGLIGLTRAMAVDHGPDGVRVNCVCPGPTDTPMLRRGARQPEVGARENNRVRLRSLLPTPADPNQVAGVIGFLLGPDAAQMTGAVVPVDGGWTAS